MSIGTYSQKLHVNLQYFDDYSSNYTTTSIPDVNWVQSQIVGFTPSGFLPLTGTTPSNPVTGTIEFDPTTFSTALFSTSNFYVGAASNSDISSAVSKAYTFYNGSSKINPVVVMGVEAEFYEILSFGSHVGTFQIGEVVQGQSSGATGTILARTNHNITVDNVSGTFTISEQVLGLSSAAHFNMSGHFYGGGNLSEYVASSNVIEIFFENNNPSSPNYGSYTDILLNSSDFTLTAQDNEGHYGYITGNTSSVLIQVSNIDGQSQFVLTSTSSYINSTYVTFSGLQYDIDYSANYTDRTLPDVAWVRNQLSSAVPVGMPNALANFDGGGLLTSSSQYSIIGLTIAASRPRIQFDSSNYLEINQSSAGDSVLSGTRTILYGGGNGLILDSAGVHNQYSYNVNDATFFSGIVGSSNDFYISHSGTSENRFFVGTHSFQVANGGSVQIGHPYNDGFNNTNLLDVISPLAYATSQRFSVGFNFGIFCNVDPLGAVSTSGVHLGFQGGGTYQYYTTAQLGRTEINPFDITKNFGWIWDNPSGTTYSYSLMNSGSSIRVLSVDFGSGSLKVANLSGSGNRIVEVDSNGILIPGTSVSGLISKASITFTPGTVNVANTITHNLGNSNISVQLWDVTTGSVILANISNATTTHVDITFSINPSGDAKAIIIG